MADVKPRPEHWAVLIGVGVSISGATGDRDPQGSIRDRSLRGPAQDIISVDEYLKTGLPALDVASFTATKSPQTQNRAVKATEPPRCLPTRDNVISSFQRILELSSPGHHVYIHYSGHGTKRKYDSAVALVLVNPANFEAEYLYGTILRSAIRSMIRKGLTVTLVLDCCFSGRVLRERQQEAVDIRYIEHDPEIDARSDYHDPFNEGATNSIRGVDVNLERLLDPDGYTIISACGPDEVASELEFEGGARRGALSYFLVDSLATLRKRGTRISHQILHQHLRAQFHACIPDQTPMLYGNQGFSFFGDFTRHLDLSTQSAQRDMNDGRLVLNAGQAHGVHKGDEYTLSPFDGLDSPQPTTSQPIRVRVEQVDCIRSRIVAVNSEHMERIKKGSVWRARLVTALSPRKVHILLHSDVPDRDGIARAATSCHFLVLSTTSSTEHDASPLFQVTMTAAQDEYEVRDAAGKKVRNLAGISAIQDGSQTALIRSLDHIAKYKFLEGIDNQMPNPSFEASFVLSTDVSPNRDGYYVIKHEKELMLTFENLTDYPLYLAIFTFTEFWEVRNLVSDRGEDAYLVVLPEGDRESGKEELPLVMSLPDELREKGQRQTEDVVKIFVTSQSSLFPGLVLPRHERNSKNPNDTKTRGELDSVERLLKELTRDSGGLRDSGSGWTTRSYLIQTQV